LFIQIAFIVSKFNVDYGIVVVELLLSVSCLLYTHVSEADMCVVYAFLSLVETESEYSSAGAVRRRSLEETEKCIHSLSKLDRLGMPLLEEAFLGCMSTP
jgi:hypothetical protein